MSQQTDLKNKIANDWLKPYRFTLTTISRGVEVLEYGPDGWEDGLEMNRNEYWGIDTIVSNKELTFYDKGKEIITAAKGNLDTVTFKVERLIGSTYDYETYYQGELDMMTYEETPTGVNIQLIESSFARDYKNRMDIKVNVLDRYSVDGRDMGTYTGEPYQITFPATSFKLQAYLIDNGIGDWSYFKEEYFFQSSGGANKQRTINITSNYTGIFYPTGSGRYELYIKRYNSDDVWQETIKLVDIQSDVNVEFNNSRDVDITLSSGDYLEWGEDVTNGYATNPAGWCRYCETLFQRTEQTVCYAIPLYEAMLRVLHKITGRAYPLYSEYFARTDSPTPYPGETYTSNGEVIHIINGDMLIGKDYTQTKLMLSVKDIFEFMRSQYPVGMGLDYKFGQQMVVIEEVDYFLEDTKGLDLSNYFDTEDYENSISPKRIPAQIRTGFSTSEVMQDILEYNTRATFTTNIKGASEKFDYISPLRGDTSGIIKLWRDYDDPEKDEQEFNKEGDIWVIKTIKEGSIYEPETGNTVQDLFEFDGSVNENNINLNHYFNLHFTPARALLRNQKLINTVGCYNNYYFDIRWQGTDQIDLDFVLSSKEKNIDDDYITENDNYQTVDFDECPFVPEEITLNIKLTTDQIDELIEKKYQYIYLDSSNFGWLLNMEGSIDQSLVKLTILRYHRYR